MLAGITEAAAILAVGRGVRRTSGCHLLQALVELGVPHDPRLRVNRGWLPRRGILRLRPLAHPGRGGHWVVREGDLIADPALGEWVLAGWFAEHVLVAEKMRVTSFIEVLTRDAPEVLTHARPADPPGSQVHPA